MAKSLKALLTQAKKTWTDDVEAAGELGGQDLPDGTYIAELVEAEVKTSQNGNHGMLTQFKVLEGDLIGQTTGRWDGLDREDAFKWLILYLRRLGVEDVEDDDFLDTFEDTVAELAEEGLVYRIQLKTKGEYQNLLVLKQLENYELEEETEVEIEGEGEEEEEPDVEEEEIGDDEEEEEAAPDPKKSSKKKAKAKKPDPKPVPEVGARISVIFDDEPYEGIVTELEEKGKVATVQFEDDTTEEVGYDELTILAAPEDAADVEDDSADVEADIADPAHDDPEVGDSVVVTVNGKEIEGEVLKVSKRKKTADVKLPRRKAAQTFAFSDLEVVLEED